MIDLVFKNYTTPRKTSSRGRQKAPGRKFFEKILDKSYKILKLKSNLELSVNLVGEVKIKQLNKKYRNKNKPTDVLSFPLGDGSGDIFICLSIAKKEAKSENISIEAKFSQLTVHGFLHLQGYDHEKSKKDAEKMFGVESKILNTLKS
ncbi:MAG: rRNA maturation RNase YbeY [Candidatus Paceibacterota bacterium]